MLWLWVVAVLWQGVCHGEQLTDNDSLRGALDAINRRQRDLADPTLYYVEHFHPPQEDPVREMYDRHSDGDGQPEDIGYGYQKSLAPKTAGIFEAIPLPESELGSHDPGVENHPPDGKALENIILDYIEDNMDNTIAIEPEKYPYYTQNSDIKRSVFRERDINDLPDSLQNFYSEDDKSDQYYENGEHRIVPSSFRERLLTKPHRHTPIQKAQALVRNFGGLNRDSEHFPGTNDDDADEYLSVLNSVWEKYQESNPDNIAPEDLSESDVEEILEYINHKEEKKREHDSNYEAGYDFFNSPLAWVKRDRQRLTNNPNAASDQFLHALKFLNSHTDTLESMREEEVPDEERDEDVAKLLMDEKQVPKNNMRYKKRFWRGNTYEDHHKNAIKRYPIAKRSSPYYTSPAVLYHKSLTDKFNQRKKKNVKSYPSDNITDPKVARELNDIFSPSDNISKKRAKNSTDNALLSSSQSSINTTNTNNLSAIKHNTSRMSVDQEMTNHVHSMQTHRKRSGQKEETSVDSQHKPLELTKKSVDWSNYFGIDKRRKKSTSKVSDDGLLLDQYLKAYSISARAIKDPGDSKHGNTHLEIDKKGSDDMDTKLRAMEDMIVDQALKYTGAHEGMTDSEEVQAVKDRVIAQLAAAYSLEKMRKALSEFKSSMAAQKASVPAHSTSKASTDGPEQKNKRVSVKKEKAGAPPHTTLEKKDDTDNGITVLHTSGYSRPLVWNQEDSCPIMDDISQRCKEIAKMAGDTTEALVPFCNIHQVCYLCGTEMGATPSECDFTFLSEANNLCGDSPRCRYIVRHTVAAMHSLQGDPSSLTCDWQNHPCLARYLVITTR